MSNDFNEEVYNDCFNWIIKARNKKREWDFIMYAGKNNDEGLEKFLNDQENDNFWPELSVDAWKNIVEKQRKLEEEAIISTIAGESTGENVLIVPTADGSAWVQYKNNLLKPISEGGKGFSRASVQSIELNSIDILNRLSLDNGSRLAKKGLVVGNVQSGKTANMGALISMAADYGWNMFIILTGTIENLRLQTQKRFMSDLQNGNITWMQIDRFGADATNELSQFKLAATDKTRYLTCCLKQVSRLEKLRKFLNSDLNKKAQLKILVIDDEADQAGLNTNDMSDPDFERSKINGKICDIVNNTKDRKPLSSKYDDDGELIGKKATAEHPYKAMNYIAYTATPYGNFLNESGRESLYPRDFIATLEPSDIYFGPQQIFGDSVRNMWEGMPIINPITGTHKVGKQAATGEISELNSVCEGNSVNLPESLRKAIAWFCIATAIRRLQQSTSPSTMLIHHDMKTGHHNFLATAVRSWFKGLSDADFLVLCENVYKEQTAQFDKTVFKAVCDKYGQFSDIDLDTDIRDYPLFKDIKVYLTELHSEIAHICLDDDSNYKFRKGINLCVDNCENRKVSGAYESYEIPYVRLVYPERGQYEGFAPAFIVIGGNTLSRGLTLEGLLCTYFSREVKQADTLMQMGRWFGYRKDYELLPRIWMTDAAVAKFEFLTELDTNLRTDLIKYKTSTTPIECGPVIMNTPEVSFIRITSANKSHGMVEANMNFAGANMQTISFADDSAVLKNNLELGEKFIGYMVQHCTESAPKDGNRIWKHVDFSIIWEQFLKDYDGCLTSIEDMNIFKQWIDALGTNGKLDKWNVVLSGPKKSSSQPWQDVNKVVRTRKIRPNFGKQATFNIGVLSDPGDWKSDLDIAKYYDGMTSEQKNIVDGNNASGKGTAAQAALEVEKMKIREICGEGNTPLMVMYCIDKDSKAKPAPAGSKPRREDLATGVDVLGVYVRIPGQKINNDFCATVTIELKEE